MDIRRQRIAGHTQRANPPLTLEAKAQHDDHRQCEAVGPQLHRLPAAPGAPELPAIGIATQATKRSSMGQ
jgi:hypothetical protein